MMVINNNFRNIYTVYYMNSNILKIGVCLLAALAMFSCKKQETSAYSTNPLSTTLYMGDQKEINVESFSVKSSTGTEVSGVTWSSADTYIADVDASSGLVTANKVGKTVVTGLFQNGKSVFCEVVVAGRSNIFSEPDITLSMNEAVEAEQRLGKVILRQSDNYFVAYDESAKENGADYSFYSYGSKICAFVNLSSAKSFEELNKVYLPERYDAKDGYYVNAYNIRAIPSASPIEYLSIVTFDDNATSSDEAVAAYRNSCNDFIDKAASASSYSQSALGLNNDITYETVDQDAVKTIVTDAKQLVSTSSSMQAIELGLQIAAVQLEVEFVKASKVSALNICHNNLSAEYKEENFYEASWNAIAELDAETNASLVDAKTIKAVDIVITNSKAKYTTITSKATIELYKNDLTKAYGKYDSSDYTPENWTVLTEIYNNGLISLESAVTLTDAAAINKKVKEEMKQVEKM